MATDRSWRAALRPALLAATLTALASCASAPTAGTPPPAAAPAAAQPIAAPAPAAKPVIYQMLVRLYGNTKTTNQPWGTLERNGVGTFADITPDALAGIRELGATHVWYTGVLHHALVRDYTAHGISDDDPDVIKGRAGSPYAIKDYYNVNPDLAVDPARRMEEFRALVERTHAAGLKVLIDLVPNHVARRYDSTRAGVIDFGERDDKTVEYARDNNFYYIPGQPFRVPAWPADYRPLGGEAHPLADGTFDEVPAKWTGNGSRSAQPKFDDWYETVKLNFGVRPDGSFDFASLPAEYMHRPPAEHLAFWADQDVPDTWEKFRDIALFWLDQGVDGFRFDMAEMVPVEFWSYLNAHIKARRADALLLAEVYQPPIYRDYLGRGLMDAIYDKVDFYDHIKLVMRGEAGSGKLASIVEGYADIDPKLLRFLENHDEQRIASPAFAGDASKGIPAMLVSATIGKGPVLMYFGQEVGEPGAGDAGFGRATRTTIFDYWGVPAHQRWVNGGRFDGGALGEDERALRAAYAAILTLSRDAPALRGAYADLHAHNLAGTPGYSERVHAFVRWSPQQKLLVVASFDSEQSHAFELAIPGEILANWHLEGAEHALVERLGSGERTRLVATPGGGTVSITLPPLAARVYELEVR